MHRGKVKHMFMAIGMTLFKKVDYGEWMMEDE